jgi:hypothetical protein
VRRTEEMPEELEHRLVKEQGEADEKSDLVRKTEEMVAERQNRLMKKQREADERRNS